MSFISNPLNLASIRNQAILCLLKRLKSKVIYYDEKDIEEKFIRGWGPGGQSVNKSSNAVHLRHLKTGIIIKNHDTRSLDQNRKRAREILNTKLDIMINGENSESALKQKEHDKKERVKYKKSVKRLDLKKVFQESLINSPIENDGDIISK